MEATTAIRRVSNNSSILIISLSRVHNLHPSTTIQLRDHRTQCPANRTKADTLTKLHLAQVMVNTIRLSSKRHDQLTSLSPSTILRRNTRLLLTALRPNTTLLPLLHRTLLPHRQMLQSISNQALRAQLQQHLVLLKLTTQLHCQRTGDHPEPHSVLETALPPLQDSTDYLQVSAPPVVLKRLLRQRNRAWSAREHHLRRHAATALMSSTTLPMLWSEAVITSRRTRLSAAVSTPSPSTTHRASNSVLFKDRTSNSRYSRMLDMSAVSPAKSTLF